MDKALSSIVSAMATWEKQNDPKTLKARVHKLLDQNAEVLLKKLLGFDNKWSGDWELDHCNGRNGESAAGDYIKKHQLEAIKEWLGQITLPEMTPAFKKKIEKDLQHAYEQEIQNGVYARVRAQADKDLNALVTQVVSSRTFEKYQQTLALLTPKNTEQG
jgi:hypothetical protein